MKLKNILISSGLLLVLLLTPEVATADGGSWQPGYHHINSYGLWAEIKVPVGAPYVPEGNGFYGQSNWVSTGGPNWIQSGWRWYPNLPGYTVPKTYYEWCLPGCDVDQTKYRLIEVEGQPWGVTVKYEVSHDSSLGADVWCVWIDGVRIECKQVVAAPFPTLARSEIHLTSRIEVDTDFLDVRQQNSDGGTWSYPNLPGGLSDHFPYAAQQLSSDDFCTFRVDTEEVYLPLAGKDF